MIYNLFSPTGLVVSDKTPPADTVPETVVVALSPTDGAVTADGEAASSDPVTVVVPMSSSDSGKTDTAAITANGDMKSGTLDKKRFGSSSTPPPERKQSKLSVLGRIFKPWKWKRRKKPSDKIRKTAVGGYI